MIRWYSTPRIWEPALASDLNKSFPEHREKNSGMKKLIFVRHGKAEEISPGLSDQERSLTVKGKIISRMMAAKLKEIEKSLPAIITSHAFRAYETAVIFATELGVESDKIIIESDIYYRMNMKHLPSVISRAADKYDTIILFGHNPSFTEMADSLASEGCDFIPKSGVACISFKMNSWSGIKSRSGKL